MMATMTVRVFLKCFSCADFPGARFDTFVGNFIRVSLVTEMQAPSASGV